jgi:gliding motility-associatede transport system auxiliary component
VTNRFLTVVGWLGTVLVALAVGRFAAVDPRWDANLVWAASAGVACVLIYAAVSWRDRARRSTAPAERSRLPMATLALAVAVVVVLTILAGSYNRRWDLTPNHVYQLSPETRAALRMLDAPVRVLLFAQQAELPAYRDRLKEYSEASRLVAIEYVDVDAQPTLVRQYDVQEYGAAVIEYEGRVELIKAASEQDFTNALIRLREGRTRKVYFTAGHAERDTASTERVGYSNIAAALQHENFLVEKINLAQQGEVPTDATLVIVAGSRVDFFRAEIDALRRYLEKGGAILLMVDPFEDLKRYITESGSALFMMDPSSASATGELRNLTAFVREQGAELGNDVVVDTSKIGQFLGTDASVPVAAGYPPHPITQGLTSLSAYPMARSVRPVPGDGKNTSSIIETSDKSWSETDIQQLAAGHLSMDPEKGDRPGPVSLGVAVSAQPASPPSGDDSPSREPRLVVVGDSDFVANYSGKLPGNAEMFLSIIHWLAQEKVVAISPRVPQERVLTMTASQTRNVFWFAILLLPGLAVGTGFYVGRRGLRVHE